MGETRRYIQYRDPVDDWTLVSSGQYLPGLQENEDAIDLLAIRANSVWITMAVSRKITRVILKLFLTHHRGPRLSQLYCQLWAKREDRESSQSI